MVYKASISSLLLIRNPSVKAYIFRSKTLQEAMGEQCFTKGWFNLR